MAVLLMKMRKAAAGLPEGKSAGRRTEDTRFCRFEDERWEKYYQTVRGFFSASRWG